MNLVKEYINSNDNFGIICHKHPDGDTLGSGFAMYYGLLSIGKNCQIYCVDKPDKVFDILDGIGNIKPLSELKEKNLIFCDCSDELRADFEWNIKEYNVLNIDHHISNTNFGNVNFVVDTACATCQVMYYVLKEIGVQLNSVIAKCLYVGICTDTNNFTNSNVNSDTFYVMSEIAKFDFGISNIVKTIFRNKSYAKTKAIALFIERIKIFFDDRFCVSYLTLDDIDRLKLDNTEGLVDIGVDIEGISVVAFLKEIEDNVFKISFRSNYDVDVRKICEVFGGGGHIKAAGCTINGSAEEVINLLSSEVAKWME